MGGDYTVGAACGCVVTFFKDADFRSSRLDPCKTHSDRKKSSERDAIVAAAMRQRDKNCHHASN